MVAVFISIILITRKLFEELSKNTESKEWVEEMLNLVRLELVEDEKEAQTGSGLGLFILYDKPPEDFFTEDMLEYGVPKGI